jgi:hypothetical protein
VPAESPANVASPPAAPAAPAPSAPASPAAVSVSAALAPVSLGVAVSAAMAFAVNPGKKTILTAKITKVTNAVFQLANSFIALAPFKIENEFFYSNLSNTDQLLRDCLKMLSSMRTLYSLHRENQPPINQLMKR